MKGLFLIRASLGETRHDISSGVSFALSIVYAEVILRELLGQADLGDTQILCIHKLAEVVMIDKHENFMLAAL